MKSDTIEIEGTLQPDGTLVLHEKPRLPPGPVRVTVQPITEIAPADQFWAGLRAIWAGQEARGHVPREKAEIDAEIRALRDEAEEEMRQIEELHRDTQGKRESTPLENQST